MWCDRTMQPVLTPTPVPNFTPELRLAFLFSGAAEYQIDGAEDRQYTGDADHYLCGNCVELVPVGDVGQ